VLSRSAARRSGESRFSLRAFSFSPRRIAGVARVPEQLLAFVGDVRGESRNPIEDGEDREARE